MRSGRDAPSLHCVVPRGSDANIPYGEGVELPGAQLSFGLFRSIRFERLIDGIEVFATWVVDHRTADA